MGQQGEHGHEQRQHHCAVLRVAVHFLEQTQQPEQTDCFQEVDHRHLERKKEWAQCWDADGDIVYFNAGFYVKNTSGDSGSVSASFCVQYIHSKQSTEDSWRATMTWPPCYLLTLSRDPLRGRSERSQFTHLPLVLLSANPTSLHSLPDRLVCWCVHHFPAIFLVSASLGYDFAFFLWFLDFSLLPAWYW